MKEMIDREASMFPEYSEAFELMKSEKPLISFEMNQNEMDKAMKFNRQRLMETVLSNMKFVGPIILGLFLFFNVMFFIARQSFSLEGFMMSLEFSIAFIGIGLLATIYRFGRLKAHEPQVFVSFSGAYFLGKFHPFRMGSCFLSAVSYIESSEKEPAVLRLTVEGNLGNATDFAPRKFGNTNTIEIPLRSEHIQDIDHIIKSLMENR